MTAWYRPSHKNWGRWRCSPKNRPNVLAVSPKRGWCPQGGICRGSRGTYPSLDLTFPSTGLSENLGGMERGRGGKGERGGWGDHLPYSPPLASASNTTMRRNTRNPSLIDVIRETFSAKLVQAIGRRKWRLFILWRNQFLIVRWSWRFQTTLASIAYRFAV